MLYGQNRPISNATYIIFITWRLQETYIYIRCNAQKGVTKRKYTQNIVDMLVEAIILPETKTCKVQNDV